MASSRSIRKIFGIWAAFGLCGLLPAFRASATTKHAGQPKASANALLRAVAQHDVLKVKKLLSDGIDPSRDAEDPDPAYPSALNALQVAFASDQVELLNGLLDRVRPIHTDTLDGLWRQMNSVSFADDPALVDCLVKHGADLHKTRVYEDPPLTIAARGGFLRISERLIAGGAPVDQSREYLPGYTALAAAAQAGRRPIVELLISHGATVQQNRTAAEYHSPFSLSRPFSPLIPVHNALQFGVKDSIIAERLIAAGADVRVQADNGDSPLALAAVTGNTEMMKVLIAHHAPFDLLDRAGFTPLMAAAAIGQTKAVKLLLEAGAPVNFANEDGLTALMVSVRSNDFRPAEILLEHGADLAAIDKQGLTALHHAATSYYLPAVKYLVRAGADLEARDSSGDTPLMRAAALGNPEMLQLLVEDGAKAEAKNHQGRTALAVAAASGKFDNIRELLFRKADLTTVDHEQKTPLAIAEDLYASAPSARSKSKTNGTFISLKDHLRACVRYLKEKSPASESNAL